MGFLSIADQLSSGSFEHTNAAGPFVSILAWDSHSLLVNFPRSLLECVSDSIENLLALQVNPMEGAQILTLPPMLHSQLQERSTGLQSILLACVANRMELKPDVQLGRFVSRLKLDELPACFELFEF